MTYIVRLFHYKYHVFYFKMTDLTITPQMEADPDFQKIHSKQESRLRMLQALLMESRSAWRLYEDGIGQSPLWRRPPIQKPEIYESAISETKKLIINTIREFKTYWETHKVGKTPNDLKLKPEYSHIKF